MALKIIVRDKKTNKKINTLNSYQELCNCMSDGDWDRLYEQKPKNSNQGLASICDYLNCYKDEPYRYTYYYTSIGVK